MSDKSKRIAERAHQIWETEGKQHGRDVDHWHEAERQLAGEGAAGDHERSSTKARGRKTTTGTKSTAKPKAASTGNGVLSQAAKTRSRRQESPSPKK